MGCNYPPGTIDDPRAPWNLREIDFLDDETEDDFDDEELDDELDS